MNLMGKILTLLIFFLSICFLVIAVMVGAAHRNWKQMANDNKQAADRAKLLLDSAKTQTNETKKLLESHRVASQLQIAQLQSQLTQAVQNRDAKEKQLAEEQVKSQARLDELQVAQARLTEQDAEVKDLRGKNKTLIDDVATQRKSVVNLTNQLFESKGRVSELETFKEDMSSQLARQIKVLKANGLTENSLVDHIPPQVNGKVADVRENFIAISLGTDDGIRPGHVVDIFRDDRFIGKAVVTKAEYNMSAARLDPSFLQTPVEKGDNVTTKL